MMGELKYWVRLKEPYIVGDKIIVDQYTNGRIKSIDESGVWVLFGEAHIPVEGTNLVPAPHPSFSEAIAYLKRLHGHHCKMGQYQFNIKVSPQFPAEVNEADARGYNIWEEYSSMCESELDTFCNKSSCDSSLGADYDWMGKWHTAGRSGGWLVIEHIKNWNHETFVDTLESLREEERRYANEPKTLAEIRDAIEDTMQDAISLSMDLQQIERRVHNGKKLFEQFMSTEEPWERILSIYREEIEEEKQRERDECESA